MVLLQLIQTLDNFTSDSGEWLQAILASRQVYFSTDAAFELPPTFTGTRLIVPRLLSRMGSRKKRLSNTITRSYRNDFEIMHAWKSLATIMYRPLAI